MDATNLRLTALESSTKVIDQEVLRDFFWTLYSKLIAVSEGLRVVYEVANRIGSVCLGLILMTSNLTPPYSGETTRILLAQNLVHYFLSKKCGHRYRLRCA